MAIQIEDIIKAEYINTDLKATCRDEALMELLEKGASGITDEKQVFDALIAREAEFTTKLMEYIAIPHAKSDAINKAMVLIGKSECGVDWKEDADFENSSEEERVKVMFMILVPGNQEGNEHLKILSLLARCLSKKDFRETVIDENNADAISEFILDAIKKKQAARK